MLSCKANPVLVQCLGFPHSGDPQLWDPFPQPCPTLASTGVTPAPEAQGPLADCLSFVGSLSDSPAPCPGPSPQDMLRESHVVCAWLPEPQP